MRILTLLLILLISVNCYGMKVGKAVSFKDPQLVNRPLSGEQIITGGQSAELNRQFDQIILAISGRIAFCDGNISNEERGENIDGQFIIFTSTGADTEITITHSLGQKPSGYIIVLQDKAGSLYHASTDTVWTATKIYLKSSVATVTYTIFIF